jgi:Icc-related predicted phosphoesterase
MKIPEKVDIISLTWNSVVFSYSLAEITHVKIESLLPQHPFSFQTSQVNKIGRVCIENLLPGTSYKVKAEWKGGKKQMEFTTLPMPSGKRLNFFAVIADPHICGETENRKGRLFVESVSILRDIVSECNERKVDFVLIAGDITNKARLREYKLAKNLLETLSCPYFVVPGDHDIRNGNSEKWRQYFGNVQWKKDVADYRIIGINTSSGVIGNDGADWLSKNINRDSKFFIILSHLQLLPDNYFTSAAKNSIIADMEEHKDIIELLKNQKTLIYSGHQNIPSCIKNKKAVQVSVPQPAQYPCGYFLVQHYKNGFYHKFQPIFSEVLRENSRQMGNLTADYYNEPQWQSRYREGRNKSNWNFICHP